MTIEHVGILAIQGDVEAHRLMLEGLGVTVSEVLSERDLERRRRAGDARRREHHHCQGPRSGSV